MRLSLWIAGSLTLLPLSAQSTTALAVRNVVLQQDESYVEFDVANQSSRPVHAWTMAITAKRRGTPPAEIEYLLTSESCSREVSGPLGAAEIRHCSVSLRSATEGPTLDVAPRITAVLFEDGSAEGDTAILDRQSTGRAQRVRVRQYWLDRFQEASAAPTPADQLRKFGEMVHAAEASAPPALAADAMFLSETRWLERQVANALQQTEVHNLDAGTVCRGLGAELERRLKIAKDAAALFPARNT